ncbi:ScbR family autoregulator-binding transcription factor [Streptomyces sp. NPDC000963]|uniref:ScbR family autoregulator-binding transcription factor n=1 Tax=unclassified Streptomyces TaxID=2593676 RepID=UPI0013956ED8|nr:TetR family transcriptional regulator [Streptomyces sp. SID2131]
MTSTPRDPATESVPDGPELKQERAFLTRAQILSAAAELFAEKGYRTTSMLNVADRVGMTKGAVYFHFRSKEALALAVVENHYGRWPAVIEEVRATGLGPMDTLREVLDRAAQAFHTDPVMQAGARLQLERPLIEADLPQPYVSWAGLLTDLMEQAREDGELRPGVEPEAAARVLLSAFFGMQHISDALSRRSDILQRWEEMRSLLFYALRA